MTLSLQTGHLRGLHGWPERLPRSHHAAGKNTSDIALALDALEALFDHRADTFFLVTSDSDFAYLWGTSGFVGSPALPGANLGEADLVAALGGRVMSVVPAVN